MDGQTECINQEIETYLQVFINHHQDDWADWLPLAEFAYKNQIHSAMHWIPFEPDTGQHPWMGMESPHTSSVEAADTFATQMSQMHEEAKAALTHQQRRWPSTMTSTIKAHQSFERGRRSG